MTSIFMNYIRDIKKDINEFFNDMISCNMRPVSQSKFVNKYHNTK